MKRSIKTLLSSVLCLMILMGTIFVPMSVSADNLASIPGAYYANPEGTRLPEENLPSNFTMLNKEGISSNFNYYDGTSVLTEGFSQATLDFGENFANLPEDMQALTFYYDFSRGFCDGRDGHDYWGAGFRFVYGDKVITAHKIGTTVDRVFKGGLLHTNEVVLPSVDFYGVFSNVGKYGGIQKAGSWTVPAGNVDAGYSITVGSSGYITMQMTKADLVAFLKAEFGEDVDATQIKFTAADHGWGMGGGMAGTTGYFQDIGVVSGADYATAVNALDAAWKTEMNFVPTNPVIYKWNPKKGDEQMAWSTYFTNFNVSGYIPDPAEGQNLKVIWWYDAAGSDVRVVADYTRFCSAVQGGTENVIHFELGDKRDHTTYYVTLDGYKKKTGFYSEDSLTANGDNSLYDSYTYGYKVFDIANKADMDLLRSMWVFRVPYAEKVDPLYIGNMGYVLDFEAFEPKLEAALQASSARVQNAISKIDAIPHNLTIDDIELIKEARAAYDALDPTNRAEGVMLPNMERKPETAMVNTLRNGETVTRIEKLEAAEKAAEKIEITKIPASKMPSNFTMLNKKGISSYFYPYAENLTIVAGFDQATLDFGENFANLPEDMQALTFYYDFSEGFCNGNGTNDAWGAGFKFVYGDKVVTAHKIGTTVDRVFKGGLLHTNEVVFPSVDFNGVFSNVGKYGGIQKAGSWTVPAGNVDAGYSIDAGSSGYISMKMTKADLVAFLKAEFGEDVDATQIKFTVADHGWGAGGGMSGTTGYFQDIGVVSGADYATAVNALDAAWKTAINYVPTNPVIYKWNPKKGDEQMPWSTYFTNFNVSGYIPDPAEGQNLKVIWWYDAAGSDVRVVADYTRFCSAVQGGTENVIHFELGDKRDHTTYYVTLDGYKKKTGFYSDDSLSGNGDNSLYDSYTYGYKVFDIANKADMDLLRSMWVFRVPYAEKVDPLYIGNMGYVLDFEAYEPKLIASLQESSARVQNAIAKIDAIPENVTFDDAAIVAEARAAYDALDPSKYSAGVNMPNMDRKTEAAMVNTLTGDETVTRLEKLEAAEKAVTPIAMIGDVKFASLAEAIAAAASGDVINVLPNVTIDEAIAPMAGDSQHKLEKSITIIGAEDGSSVLTGGIYIGYQDGHTRDNTITIENLTFNGKGLTIADEKVAVIKNCTFNNIEGDAIAVLDQEYDGQIGEVSIENCTINGATGAGINLRNPAIVYISANSINNTGGNGITMQKNSKLAANASDIVITNNTITNWAGSGANEGRAMRIAIGTGDVAKSVTITGNVMTNSGALTEDDFLKVTYSQATVTADLNGNYWNSATPDLDVILSTGNISADVVENYYADSAKQNLVSTAVATINGVEYKSLAAAVEAANDGDEVTLLCNAEGVGMVIDKDITIDFGGYTYTITSPVGSTGTVTNGFQLLKNNDITLKNGTITVQAASASDFAMLIQNYANLTLTDITLDGTFLDRTLATSGMSYALSINSGAVEVNGNTNIIANNDGDKAYAFDVYDYSSANYVVPTVSINTTGTISGNIEVSETITDNLDVVKGVFTADVSDYLADGNGTVFNGSTWVVDTHLAVADIDGNGSVGASDLVILRKELSGATDNNCVYDINGDGKFDVLDVVRLKKLAS